MTLKTRLGPVAEGSCLDMRPAFRRPGLLRYNDGRRVVHPARSILDAQAAQRRAGD